VMILTEHPTLTTSIRSPKECIYVCVTDADYRVTAGVTQSAEQFVVFLSSVNLPPCICVLQCSSFSILVFNHILRNELHNFLKNLILLNRVIPSDVIYEVVTPCTLVRLLSHVVCSNAATESRRLSDCLTPWSLITPCVRRDSFKVTSTGSDAT
jgi:hypothetical protein